MWQEFELCTKLNYIFETNPNPSKKPLVLLEILTFVAVTNCVEVDVVVVVVEEQQAEPGVERVDRDDEEDAHDPPLLVRTRVVT